MGESRTFWYFYFGEASVESGESENYDMIMVEHRGSFSSRRLTDQFHVSSPLTHNSCLVYRYK